ncbi:PIN domain-containing protein [Halonotius pteroides]|uniref:Uncharacterized protein n=1 Tax=Halonotius pteroides TaxID=268735 RepID=A0A3A6Q0K2_9EURY|nr:PIN domain-containing protein [Halonotius pteroides]RJX50314.1 hypothetical protein DP106_05265 [Halonotius pteroides]
MRRIVLDTNAVIMHGRSFPTQARTAARQGERIILPRAVKQELVDDVLSREDSPANHKNSAQTIQELIDQGILKVQVPDFEAYSDVIDEARRRIADESLPEHAVQADQYIPALICELATDGTVCLVTADSKLRNIVDDITTRRGVNERVDLENPTTVL